MGERLKALEEALKGPRKHASSEIEDVEQTAKELGLLLQEVDKVQSINVKLESERRGRKPEPVATFDMLWMLFELGQYVYFKLHDYQVAARIRLLGWDKENPLKAEDSYTMVTIRVWYLDYDGKPFFHTILCNKCLLDSGQYINRRIHNVEVQRFRGERVITDLPVYPE